jgi:hypothetical protein
MMKSVSSFCVGAFVGAGILSAAWFASVLWRSPTLRSSEDAPIYDNCLYEQKGNVTSCDALMRMYYRDVDKSDFLKKEGAKMRAAGATKRSVVKWATDNGAVGRQISDAAGISLDDLQGNKY